MKTYYLDNAATSFPKAPGVGDAVSAYLRENGTNVNRGSYQRATDAALCVLHTRELLAKLFHYKGRPNGVIFTPGATWGLNQILRGYLKSGDHVVVSSLEHNAVMRPLTALEKMGVSFSRIPADRQGISDPASILPLLRPNTRLVMLSHASNVSGTIFPLEEAARICRERSIPLAVDAAQSAGHIPVDFDALGLAALCVPAHKGLLGPQGLGAMLLEENFAKRLVPLISGGTGSVSDSESQPDYLPDKFESGTMNLPGIFGLHASLTYLFDRGLPALRAHEIALSERFLHGIEGLPLRVAGPIDSALRVGVISLDLANIDNALASDRLESEFGVLTRCGLHCAPNAPKTLGTFPQGTVRFSIGYSTDEAEVDHALEALRAICAS